MTAKNAFFGRFMKARKAEGPTEADLARARMRELTAALTEKRPVSAPPPLRRFGVTSESLEKELDDEEETPTK